jgi:hypothetical protein
MALTTIYLDGNNQVRTFYFYCDAVEPSVYTDIGWVRHELSEEMKAIFEPIKFGAKAVLTDGVITDFIESPEPERQPHEEVSSPCKDDCKPPISPERASANAKLKALGLTDEEIDALKS